MSEPNLGDDAPENLRASEQETELPWENTIEEFEGQKQMLKESVSTEPDVTNSSPNLESASGLSVATEQSPNLQFILDIPLQITVELGRKRLLVNELLQLNQGSVIELNKQIGEPFDVLVNQKLIARGEVVVINEKFGIRITDIISPIERVQQL